jgi:adenine-specific DNA-methyltransferase
MPTKINVSKISDIEKVVDKIVMAKTINSHADTKELEDEIDRQVYKLYGLTEDEIAIVEDR